MNCYPHNSKIKLVTYKYLVKLAICASLTDHYHNWWSS